MVLMVAVTGAQDKVGIVKTSTTEGEVTTRNTKKFRQYRIAGYWTPQVVPYISPNALTRKR